MKLIKLFCLFLTGILLTSCHFVPSGLFTNVEFILNDDVLKAMKNSLQSIDKNTFYINIDTYTDGSYASEEVYVCEDTILWYSSNDDAKEGYRNGTCYKRALNTGKLVKTKGEFSKTEYENRVNDTYLILEKIFSSNSNNFIIEASRSINIDDEDYISVALEFKKNSDEFDELKKVIPDLSNDGVRIEFNCIPEEDKYFDYIVSWNSTGHNYYVMLEPEECPSTLAAGLDTLIKGE